MCMQLWKNNQYPMQTSNPVHRRHHGHQHDGEPDVIIINKEEDDDVICTCVELSCMDTLCAKHIFPPGVSVGSPEAGSRGTTDGALIFREGKRCWTSGTRSLTPLTFCSHTALLWVSHSSHTHTHACRWTLLHDFLLRVSFRRTLDAHTFALRALADGVATAGC